MQLPLRSHIEPKKAEDGERRRLAIRSKIAKEATEKTTAAQLEHDEIVQRTREEATEILTRARDQATAVVSGAKNEQGRIEEAARQKGLLLGRDEARKEALAHVQSAVDTLAAAAANLREEKSNFLRSGADGMIEIISVILERILRAPIKVDDDLVRRTIAQAVTEVTSSDTITIRVNPDDLGVATEFQKEILGIVENLSDITIIPDAGITRGGALIETAFGRIDARLETQLAEILRQARVEVGAFSPDE